MKKKIILGILFICAILIFSVVEFFRGAVSPVWSANNRAIAQAYHKTDLIKANKVETFVGEKSHKIIFGTDKQARQMIVWLSSDEVHTEYAANGISENSLKALFKTEQPTAKIVRIMPGKLFNDWVWELYYKKMNADHHQQYYYNYYKFNDGSLIDTFDLGTGKYTP